MLPNSGKYLVLERGPLVQHPDQVANRQNSPIRTLESYRQVAPEGVEHDKIWQFNIGFGGSSNCWWGGSPRMLPADFEMQTRYGVGRDWPISYDELAPYYSEVERVMQIAGSVATPFPNRPEYPLPGHRMTAPDRALAEAYPDQYFNQPTARASRPNDQRGVCCANGVCHLCPVDAKFTIQNGMREVYDDPRVTLLTDARVMSVDVEGGVAKGVVYVKDGKEVRVTSDAVVMGANAIFNPHLLLSSGLTDGPVGQRLHEQGSFRAYVYLDGMCGFEGSSSITGHGYMLYDGEHRKTAGAALIEGWNVPRFRLDHGRWTEMTELYVIVEDLPKDEDTVTIDPQDPNRPLVTYSGHGDYFFRGVDRVKAELEKVLAPLPVERIEYRGLNSTEAHNQGTTAMGDDPATSVVDRDLIHHKVRNLHVLGNSVYPTGAPANPTLTNTALATRAAEVLG
ncbi:MAG: GMC family oxidoreductase [Pseudomonadota bacterium]